MANAVFCCGRMNPVTLGHVKLTKMMDEYAAQHDAETQVFSTFTHDPERNPLAPEEKQSFLVRALGRPVELTKSPFSAIEVLADKGFTEATFFVGEDRMRMAEAVSQYARTLDVYVTPLVICRPIDDVSATELRQAALIGDYAEFCKMAPAPDASFQTDLYHAVRHGMGVRDVIIGEHHN